MQKNHWIYWVRGVWLGLLLCGAVVAAPADVLKQSWADAKYVQTGNAQKEAFEQLAEKAAAMQQSFPEDPAVRLWRGTILSSYAAAIGGRQALGILSEARDLLEASIAQAPDTEQGLAYGVLGALYYRVPAWPLSFRDTAKAKKYLEKGVALYPNNPDLQYYYGDFLRATHAYDAAQLHLEAALEMKPSAGRRGEIQSALAEVEKQIK